MAQEASKFKIGLFLIGGFVLLNALVIWVGATRFFQDRVTYTSYFQESVQGLDVGSSVKYRGVSIGSVSAIRVAPDGRLVEVRMELDPSFQVQPQMRAHLAIVGITGGTFVEVGFPAPGADTHPPELSFPAPKHYIPSQRSFLTNLMSAISDVVQNLRGAQIPRLVDEYRALASDLRDLVGHSGVNGAVRSVEAAAGAVQSAAAKLQTLAEDPRVSQTLDHMGSAAAGLDRAATAAARVAEDPRVEDTLARLHQAADSLRDLAREMERQVGDLHVGKRLDAVETRVEGLLEEGTHTLEATGRGAQEVTAAASGLATRTEGAIRQLEEGLQRVLARIGDAARRIDNLAASLEENPSRLLQEPPKEVFP